jgi:hypothetical protein
MPKLPHNKRMLICANLEFFYLDWNFKGFVQLGDHIKHISFQSKCLPCTSSYSFHIYLVMDVWSTNQIDMS